MALLSLLIFCNLGITTAKAEESADLASESTDSEEPTLEYFPLTGFDESNISSMFGSRAHPITGVVHNHGGIDIAAPQGTPIHACADGTVITSKYGGDVGNYIVIDHGNGLYTEYMHQVERVAQVGDTVEAGDVIGYVGTTGDSTGPHLHIGVCLSDHGFDIGNRVDPYPYLFGEKLKEKEAELSYEEPVCIIAITEDSELFENESAVVSSYNNVYLLEYEGEDKAKEAYQYYINKVDMISFDAYLDDIKSSGENISYIQQKTITKENNPFNILNNIDTSKEINRQKGVAIIGTPLTDVVALRTILPVDDEKEIDENLTKYTNRLYDELTKEKNDFEIYSIDITDLAGKYSISSLYSAIKYATERKIATILLPDISFEVLNNEIISKAITDYSKSGGNVLYPAGDETTDISNKTKNENLIVVGSCFVSGLKTLETNYGNVVDYNVVSNNSVTATVKLAKILAENNLDYIKQNLNKKDFFESTFIPEEYKKEKETADNSGLKKDENQTNPSIPEARDNAESEKEEIKNEENVNSEENNDETKDAKNISEILKSQNTEHQENDKISIISGNDVIKDDSIDSMVSNYINYMLLSEDAE